MSQQAGSNEEWLARLKLSGELDAYVAPEVRRQIEEIFDAGHRWLLIDLSDVDYIDSVGLGIMVGAAKRANELGGDVAIAASKPAVVRVFEISGTKELLNVVETVDEAQELLSSSRQRSEAAAGGEQ